MAAKVELWDDGKTVAFDCPGCGTTHALNICEQVERPRWGFNGNLDAPTFTPSILSRWFQRDGVTVRDVCHSFVTDGRIQFLGDCTHALANQTVDLKPCEV